MKWRLVVATAAFALASVTQVNAQTRIVTGRVVDSLSQDPVASGQVAVQGSTVATTVKDDGTFTIAVPARDVTLSVRSIGFKHRDIPVPASQNVVAVSLERDYFQLEAIVVTGQATGVEKRNLANAVSTISAAQLNTAASTASIDQALQGKLAGAQIYSNTAAPGGDIQVKMRSGLNSVLGNSLPLWVVDGVIINNQEIGSGLNQISRGGGTACNASGSSCGNEDQVQNRAADINPNDIENIEVLKGAAAAAIYGSKANNGVIIITTKKGQLGKPQFSVTQRVGRSEISHRLGPFRTFTSIADASTAFDPAKVAATWTDQVYDHEMEVFGRKPINYETSVSMGGGSENTRYFASGLVHHDGGIQDRTFYDKHSIRLNLDQNMGSRLSFGFSLNGIHSDRAAGVNNNDNSQTAMYIALPYTPTWLDIRQQPDGSWPLMPFTNSNVLQTTQLVDVNENVWRIIPSSQVSLSVINSASQTLKLVATGGIDWYAKRDVAFAPPNVQFMRQDQTPVTTLPGSDTHSATFVNQMNVTTSLVHTFKPASAVFSATTSVGASRETRGFNFSQIFSRYLITGIENVSDGVYANGQIQQTINKVNDAGYFAQEEFLTLKDRLMLTAGITADQSSTNSDPTQLYYYPKLGASFRLNPIRGVLDEVKLRTAFGETGNKPQYSDKFTSLCTSSFEGIPAISVSTATACNTLIAPLKPERQAEIEGGFDATVVGGRANIEFTGYRRTVSNLLINRTLLPSSGWTSARFNGATIRTNGVEAAVNIVPLQSRSLTWQLRTTFSTDKTRILYLPVPPFIATGSYQLGAARFVQDSLATDVWGNDTLGAGDPLAPAGYPGCKAAWVSQSVNGCLVVQRKIGDLNPKFTMGFGNDLKWKALSFNFLVAWQNGGLVSNLTRWLIDQIKTTKDYLTPCAPTDQCLTGETIGSMRNRLFPAYVTKINVEDASYVKLREVNLGFDLPKSVINRFWTGARFVRVSVSGRNLITSTNYSGADPEVSNNGSRNIRIGFDDIAPYPPSRSFWFNVDLGF